jgi:plastocyanin
MRKLLLVLIAVALLAAAGAAVDRAKPAAAASQTVTISKTGYTPTSVSIIVGDTIVFANSDTVAHTVVFKTATGFRCDTALPVVIQPGKSASCTFATAGRYTFSDLTSKGKNFRGSVTVGQSATSSLTAHPNAVVFGGKATIAGTLADKQSGEAVQVLGLQCGATNATVLATVTSTTGGAFTYSAQPLRQTAYSVRVKNASSGAANVRVMPSLRLGKVARHRYTLRISAADSFAGKTATFQRYNKTKKRWVKVKRVVLGANTTGVAPTVVTSATFRSGIKARQRVRVTLGAKQVGSCYIAGRSNTIRS